MSRCLLRRPPRHLPQGAASCKRRPPQRLYQPPASRESADMPLSGGAHLRQSTAYWPALVRHTFDAFPAAFLGWSGHSSYWGAIIPRSTTRDHHTLGRRSGNNPRLCQERGRAWCAPAHLRSEMMLSTRFMSARRASSSRCFCSSDRFSVAYAGSTVVTDLLWATGTDSAALGARASVTA